MRLEGEQVLLRVHLRNTDKHGWFSPPAAEELMERAREGGLAGGTLLRGILGLDVTGELLESSPWSIVEHSPVIVEMVDGRAQIARFLPTVAAIVPEGLATLERAHVLLYRRGDAAAELARLGLDLPDPVEPLSTLPSTKEFPEMTPTEQGQLLRVFIGDSDLWEGQPLYRAIVLKAKELGLGGATVLRAALGFGANSQMHGMRLLELSADLPIVIEIVDTAGNLQRLLPFLDETVGEGLITIEEVRVVRYRRHRDPGG